MKGFLAMQEHDYSTPHNFDYKSWFEKDNLTHEQIAWCILGVNPDAAEEAINSAIHSDEGDLFLRENHEALIEIVLFDGTVKSFVQGAYEHRFTIPSEIKEYLIESGLLELNNDLEKFKNHEQYEMDYKKLKSIDNEKKALAFLLGVELDNFIRFYELRKRQITEKNCKKGLAPYVRFSREEKWFFKEYKSFLTEKYLGWECGHIIKAFEAATDLKVWNDDFKSYVQALHDNGFVFKEDVYGKLKNLEVNLKYSKDAPIRKFFKHWKDEELWTSKETIGLLRGINFEEKKCYFHDLSQKTIYSDSPPLLQDLHYTNLEKQIDKVRQKNELKGFERKKTNEYEYNPLEVLAWIKNNTYHTLHPALIEEMESTKPHQITEGNIYTYLNSIYPKIPQLIEEKFKNPSKSPTMKALASAINNEFNSGYEHSYLEKALSSNKVKQIWQEHKKGRLQ